MRITGGQAKGRLLMSPKGIDIRPSSDQVREAIFNIMGQDLLGLKVLDLFAGTGSLGIEALSRGALCALFVDKSRQSIELIKKNLSLCGYQGSGTILKRDLKDGIFQSRPLPRGPFDLVFLDPPYGKDFLLPLLKGIITKYVLSPKSWVVAKSSKRDKLPVSHGNLGMVDTRLYGDTKISIYTYEAIK